jgi:hypothetical protein
MIDIILASCLEHFISIKHRILATFNINKKNQFERLYAFKNTLIDIDQYLYDGKFVVGFMMVSAYA